MKGKIFILSLAITIAVSMIALPQEAHATSRSEGICGKNLTWTLDSSGTLTVRGNGDMTDFDIRQDIPWNDRIDEIKEIIIDFGVTSIGEMAFWGCENAENVSIPNSVTMAEARTCYWITIL